MHSLRARRKGTERRLDRVVWTVLAFSVVLLACSNSIGELPIEVHWATLDVESCSQCDWVEYELPSGLRERWLVEPSPMTWTFRDVAEVRVLGNLDSMAPDSVSVALLPTDSGRAALNEFTEHGTRGGPIAFLVDGRMLDLGALAPNSKLLLIDIRNEEGLDSFLDKTNLRSRITP